MTQYDVIHISALALTLLFFIASSYLVSKMNRFFSWLMIALAAIAASLGIFYRYALALGAVDTPDFKQLSLQMLQVCGFNFILLPLCLIPGFRLARQYAVFFSMLAAASTLFSPPGDWAGLEWYDMFVFNSWFNHVFAVAAPLWLIASRREKPELKYVPWVSLSVLLYFSTSAAIQSYLIGEGIISEKNSFSFIYNTLGVPFFDFFYSLIPHPYFYLLPIWVIVTALFLVAALIFKPFRLRDEI